MGKKLTKPEEIRKFVVETIKSRKKERIVKVLRRYWEWLKENGYVREKSAGTFEIAREIFEIR